MTVEEIARMAHEVNKTYCEFNGDYTQKPWELAEDWQRESCIDGVKFVFNNPDATPEDQHKNWMVVKVGEGWAYGEKKDPEAKTHPCMVPYDELPEFQRLKDHLFRAVAITGLRTVFIRSE